MIILGSSGSIGTQALQIAREHHINIEVLCAGDNIALLNKQIAEFHPKIVVIKDSNKKHLVENAPIVLCGESGIIESLNIAKSHFVLNALVGFSGVKPSLEALRLNKTLALANKESLVVAGFLIDSAKLKQIIPVDSEHFALKELLSQNKNIKRMILTASGGAFRDLPLSEIPQQKAESALKHPNWRMGAKITIDSATMINKLFEILEAKWLFDSKNIDAIIERSSTIHALIETQDNAILTHLSTNDMRLPISHAMLGSSVKNPIKTLDLLSLNLSFNNIDTARYPLWNLKSLVLDNPKLGILINAANDILVERFLNDKIDFGGISRGIFAVLDTFSVESIANIDDIVALNAKIARFLIDLKRI